MEGLGGGGGLADEFVREGLVGELVEEGEVGGDEVSFGWEVLVAQVVRYPQLGTNVDTILKCIGEEPLVDFARRFVMENGIEIFNFGKHKGRAVADILKAEPQYYDWMMKGDFPLHTKQKLTEIFNRTMLKKG